MNLSWKVFQLPQVFYSRFPFYGRDSIRKTDRPALGFAVDVQNDFAQSRGPCRSVSQHEEIGAQLRNRQGFAAKFELHFDHGRVRLR